MDSDLLHAAAAVLRCPVCRKAQPNVVSESLCCPVCDHTIPEIDGVLDALGTPPDRPSFGQRVFLNRAGARIYAALREGPAVRLFAGIDFRDEVEHLLGALDLRPDAAVVDVPCGQGNFMVHLADRVRAGIVIAVDLSGEQLRLARERARRDGLRNIVLVRASALDLPVATGALAGVLSCGGLHLYPDVPRAIAEMRRVLGGAGRVAGLTLRASRAIAPLLAALRGPTGVTFFDFDALAADLARAGFEGVSWEPHGIIGHFHASAGPPPGAQQSTPLRDAPP